MARTLHILLLLSCILLSGCKKKEFTIVFDVEESVNANYRLLYYASDKTGGFIRESAVAISGGKGEFSGPAINPMIVYLFAGNKSYPLMIYAERGEKIEITGESRNPAEWTVSGNEINQEWSVWRNENAKALAAGDEEKINKGVAAYVMKHPDNPLSALLLLTAYSRTKDETGFRRLWRDLQGEAADPKWGEMLGRSDVPTRFVPTPGRLKSMAMRSLHNGVDTIRPDSAGATLMFFWNSSLDNRKELTDSLKALAKEYKDSATRIIADISLDPDSTAWRSTVRYDSMKNVVRLWAPAGLADRRLMQLSVPGVPYFIIFSPDGHQQFRGSDLPEAFKTFRSLLKKKK